MSKVKKKVRLMPAIREESSINSSRIPVHIIPPGARAPGPLRQSMIIHNLPDESRPRPTHPAPEIGPLAQAEPSAVKQLVRNYLKYPGYGYGQPLTMGFAPAPCLCCQDRNRENFQRLQDRHRAPIPKPDPESLSEPVLNPKLNPASGEVSHVDPSRRHRRNNNNNSVGFSRISPRGKPRDWGPASWASYQPQPLSADLRPEFYRLALLESQEQDRRQVAEAQTSYLSGQVVDADSKYHLAMDRLKRALHRLDSGSSLSKADSR